MGEREDTKTGYDFQGRDTDVRDPEAPHEIEDDEDVTSTMTIDPLIGKVVGGRFKIARCLGNGNMARVYLAEQLSMNRNVAVKVLQPQLIVDEVAAGRFRQEIEAVSRLHSPHTIEFFDVGRTDAGTPYIVMEFLAGETLRHRLDEDHPLSIVDVVTIVKQIACSLQEAHEAGVLHRDLKPENVHFCRQATPLQPFIKLLDFGLAKLLDPTGPVNPNLTGKRTTVGTPAYMAPEMIVEERTVDHRIDIYSLGVMCFEMLTGTRPFQVEGTMQMALAHVREPVPSAHERNPQLPPEIDEFFQCVMAKDPENRPEQAEDLGRFLASAVGDRRPY